MSEAQIGLVVSAEAEVIKAQPAGEGRTFHPAGICGSTITAPPADEEPEESE